MSLFKSFRFLKLSIQIPSNNVQIYFLKTVSSICCVVKVEVGTLPKGWSVCHTHTLTDNSYTATYTNNTRTHRYYPHLHVIPTRTQILQTDRHILHTRTQITNKNYFTTYTNRNYRDTKTLLTHRYIGSSLNWPFVGWRKHLITRNPHGNAWWSPVKLNFTHSHSANIIKSQRKHWRHNYVTSIFFLGFQWSLLKDICI